MITPEVIQIMEDKFGDDFKEFINFLTGCPRSGGKNKKRSLKGGVNPKHIKYFIYAVIAFLIGANLLQSREAIISGITQISDGTCNSALTRWSYLPHPICAFWIGYVDAIRQVLRGNVAVIAAFAALIQQILKAPGRIDDIIRPFSENIATFINGPSPPLAIMNQMDQADEDLQAATALLALRNGPAGGKRRKRTQRIGGRKSTKGKMCGGKKRRSMRRKRTRCH